jgi:trans-2,3-dihydro-3-hydroxyanthranilate isomerase
VSPLRFVTLDVFTARRFAGNPLAVVLDAEGLSDGEMQAIAAEFNLSETVFVLPPADPVNTARLRIFTTATELPFAGHPTVGAAVLIATQRAPEMLRGGVRIVLEEAIGPVACDVRRLESGETRAVFTAPRIAQELPYAGYPAMIAAALGIGRDRIGFGLHRVSLWSAGVPFVMAPLANLETLAEARIADRSAWNAVAGPSATGSNFAGLYCYARAEPESPLHIRARMFEPSLGMPEDPATGSAAAAFAGVAAAFERPEDGDHQILIGQGYEMGRPSDIAVDLRIEAGALVETRIGGAAVIVSEGQLHL